MKRTLRFSLSIFLFFLCAGNIFGQASACPQVTIAPVAPICPGCTNLTATVQGSVATTSYSVSTIPYSPYSYTTGTPVLVNIDDVWTPVITMPFCFQFYGNTYTQLVIGSNGLISFNTAYANAYCQWPISAAIPSASNPINSIMAPYHDIDPSIGSSSDTRYQVYGSAPCREFVISWYNIPMFSSACNSQLASQQIVLHETTNIIDIYITNKPLCTSWNGGAAIEGIQNAAGTAAVAVAGRNYPTQWTASNDGKRFMPTGAPQYTINWTGPSGSLGSANPITVCPSVTTTYTCTVTNTTCAAPIVVSATQTVTVSAPFTITPSQTDVSCNGGCNGTATGTPSPAGTYTYSWAPVGGSGPTASGLCAGTYTLSVTNSTACTVTQTFTITQPPALTATQSQVNVTCNGACTGSATVVPGGGTPGYSYSWAPSGGTGPTASGRCAGTYTCTITDANGCVITKTFSITQPPALTTTGSQVNVTCNGSCNGSATTTGSGGTSPYTYSWAPVGGTGTTASALCAGTYTCTVTDANGCTTTRTFTITQPPALTATQSQVNILCNGACTGSATVVPSGGTPGYSYSWAPSGGTGPTASSRCAGTYTCTITDANGCSITKTFTITQPPALAATSTNTPATCGGNNGSATANPSGGTSPYSYSWNTVPVQNTQTATGLTAGTYTCTITDANGCTTTVAATVGSTGGITASITSVSNVTCNGGNNGSATATPSGGTGPYNYVWTPSGGNAATGTPLAAGNYTCTITDANGCIATVSVVITQPPVITATQSQVNILCNGSCTGVATVVPAGGNGTYSYSWAPSGGSGASASSLCAGTYTCTISSPAGCSITQSFTITQPPALTASGTHVNELCNGGNNGTATATPAGGTGPYTYSWNTTPVQNTQTATGLTAGSYTCTVTDANSCTTTVTFTITQPSPVTVSISTTPSTCGNPNGSATATGSGGVGPYTYSWNTSPVQPISAATGLLPGSYTVTVTDANGCSTTGVANVTNTGGPAASISSSTNIVCFGGSTGSATATQTGGTGPFSYSWNSTPVQTTATASGLPAGSYTVTVTDANGCQSTASVTLTQNPAITTTSSQVNVLCNGSCTGVASVVPSGGTGTYTYAWSPSGGSGSSASSLCAGTYSCVISSPAGCSITQSFSITQPPALTATGAQVNELCNGGNNATATATPAGGVGPYSYSWNTSPVQTTQTATGLTAGSYTCTVSDANSCSTTVTFTITQPIALTTTTSFVQSTCGNANGSATATPSGGTGTYSYSWNTTPVQTTQTATGLLAGTYIVTITDVNACSITATVTVPNAGSPTATITSTTDVSCFGGNNGDITVSGSGGTGPYTYSWTSAPVQTTATASGLTAGSYTVTVTDANNCTATASATITEPPALTISGSSTNVDCFGNATGTADVVTGGGTPVYAYSWNSTPVQTTPSATGLPAGTYTCTVTDANGCIITQTATVTEPTQLTVAVAGFNVSCFGSCDGQVVVIPNGGTPNYSFSWNTGCNQPSCNNVCAGTYTVNVTDANGCVSSASTTVTEPTPIVINTSEVDAHCNLSDGSASAIANGGTGTLTYQWIGGPATANDNNIPAATYSVIVTDANGCADTATATVNNLNGVTASLTSVTNLTCFNSNDGAIVTGAAGGVSPYTYSWTAPAVSVTGSASSLSAGSYTLTVTDASGCAATVSATVTQPTAVTLTASATPPAVCAGSGVQLSATGGGGTPGYTYSWMPNAMVGNTQNIIPAATTTYTAYVADANGCSDSTTVLVTVNPVPVAVLSGNLTSGCAPLCVDFSDMSTVAAPGVISSWSWDFGDNSPVSTQQNPSHCFTNPGVYTVSLDIVTADGCTASVTMPAYINVFANPVAAFGASPQPTTILNPVIQFSDSSINATSWSWSFGDLTNATSVLQNPSFTYTDPTCYQVVLAVASADGCVDTTSKEICIGPDAAIFVPNAFTPNDDGVNEVFMPVGVGIDPDHFEMWIFDRWGNMIYYTDDLNKGWDGRVQGHSDVSQIDTYVWKIKALDIVGNKHNIEGKVSLIR
jgi:gliding motility-associated-like protein